MQSGTGGSTGGLPHTRRPTRAARRRDRAESRRSRLPRNNSSRVSPDGARTPQRQLADLEARLAELEAAAKQGECRIDEGEQQLRESQRLATATRVERAKSEQRLDGMRLQLRQFEADQQERSRALADAQRQLASAADRRRVAVQSVLQATSELALLYLAQRRPGVARSPNTPRGITNWFRNGRSSGSS